jgi:hypothetical protein
MVAELKQGEIEMLVHFLVIAEDTGDMPLTAAILKLLTDRRIVLARWLDADGRLFAHWLQPLLASTSG